MDNSSNPKWYLKTTVRHYVSGGIDSPYIGMRNKRIRIMGAVQQKQLAKADNDKSNR